jgi:hypothetical protein
MPVLKTGRLIQFDIPPEKMSLFNYRIGDRVRIISKDYARGEVTACDLNWQDLPLYVIKFFEYKAEPPLPGWLINPTDNNSLEKDMILDHEYYREIALNKILENG